MLIIGILSFPVFSQCISGDCVNGKGKYKMLYGDVYTGDFKNYERTGYGVLEINSGSHKGNKYVGEFVNGKFQGGGKYTYNDGSSLEGIWENNEYISEYPKNYKKSKKNVSQTNSPEKQIVVSKPQQTKSSQNKSVVSKPKPKKVPTTRKCECCGIVFKIEYGWGSSNGEIFRFGTSDEMANNVLLDMIKKMMGESDEYHPLIKYHSKTCAYDCGN